jgi:hypothetical protein
VTYLLAIRGLLSRVPPLVWAIIGLLAVWGIDRTTYGARRYDDGRESVLSELRKAEAEAAQKAVEAVAKEGAKGAARAAEFDKQQETLRDAIEKAEAANQNALDGLF